MTKTFSLHAAIPLIVIWILILLLGKRARLNNIRYHNNGLSGPRGILRNNIFRRQMHHDFPVDAQQDINDDAWHLVALQNKNMNLTAQTRWRGALAFPTDLSIEKIDSATAPRSMRVGFHVMADFSFIIMLYTRRYHF